MTTMASGSSRMQCFHSRNTTANIHASLSSPPAFFYFLKTLVSRYQSVLLSMNNLLTLPFFIQAPVIYLAIPLFSFGFSRFLETLLVFFSCRKVSNIFFFAYCNENFLVLKEFCLFVCSNYSFYVQRVILKLTFHRFRFPSYVFATTFSIPVCAFCCISQPNCFPCA